LQKFQDNDDLELTPFIRGKLNLYQKKRGYRFSIDSVLLADFVKINKKGKLIDLGTGSGILLLLLSLRYKNLKFYALEVQQSLYEIAKKNFELNRLSVELKNADIKQIKDLYPSNSFDFAITNPPFHQKIGKKYATEEEEIAKSEKLASIRDFIEAGRYLLKDRGKFYLINKTDRLVETLNICTQNNLIPKRLRFVHPSKDEKSTHFLLECIKNAKLGSEIVEKPLIIYNDKNKKLYTRELEKLLNEF